MIWFVRQGKFCDLEDVSDVSLSPQLLSSGHQDGVVQRLDHLSNIELDDEIGATAGIHV